MHAGMASVSVIYDAGAISISIMQYLTVLFLLVCGLQCIHAAPLPVWDPERTVGATADRITFLPGLDVQPSFKQYSGYISVNDDIAQVADDNNTRHLHYWFTEAANKPESAPVVLWLNGGPGCSSLLGLLTENGAFQFDEANVNLTANPYAWNLAANMLYLEQPAGVGFSYGGNLTSGDVIAKRDNYQFLLKWFNRFPEFKKRSFYITGESYAGQYIPQLADQILTTKTPVNYTNINLKGLLVGNPSGLTSTDFAHSGYMMLRQHALISDDQLYTVKTTCNMTGGQSVGRGKDVKVTDSCADLENNLWEHNLKGINPYNILAPCLGDGPGQNAGCATQNSMLAALNAGEEVVLGDTLLGQSFVPCGDYNSTRAYLNRPDVKAALHISESAFDWEMCSQYLTYNQYSSGTPELYQKMNGKIQLWVFSGDLDTCVPFLITQYAIGNLGFTQVGSWRPWRINDDTYSGTSQIAGYLQEYKGLVYQTVKGAGHMVAMDKPQQALVMFQNFLSNSVSSEF
jgi:serine carboxypeptidase-like clade 2